MPVVAVHPGPQGIVLRRRTDAAESKISTLGTFMDG